MEDLLLYLMNKIYNNPVLDMLHYRIYKSIVRNALLYVFRGIDLGSVSTFAFAYPSLMVMFRSISFLKRIVWTPEIALTTVDFPCATCPIVPIFIVACLLLITFYLG